MVGYFWHVQQKRGNSTSVKIVLLRARRISFRNEFSTGAATVIHLHGERLKVVYIIDKVIMKADLRHFCDSIRIHAEDRTRLESHGITDIKSLQKQSRRIYRKGVDGVSDRTQELLRALIHYLDEYDTFEENKFVTHMLLHSEKLKKRPPPPANKASTSEPFVMSQPQGFDPSDKYDDDEDEDGTETLASRQDGGPNTAYYGEIRFEKGSCYHKQTSKGRSIVGIRSFVVDTIQPNHVTKANCILIWRASDTFLGQGKNNDFEVYSSKYVQVWNEQSVVHLSELEDTCEEPIKMPKICYKAQEKNIKRSLAYFFDPSSHTRIGLRDKPPKVIELFCGAGGMHLGFKASNFETIKAVDLNEEALATFCRNNPRDGKATECICVNEFLKRYRHNGIVECLQASSPCQGFSTLNRNQEESPSDKINNELALTFSRGLRKTQALTGIFENVSLPHWSLEFESPMLHLMLSYLVTHHCTGWRYLEWKGHAVLETYVVWACWDELSVPYNGPER